MLKIVLVFLFVSFIIFAGFLLLPTCRPDLYESCIPMPRWKIYIGQLLGTKKDEAQSNYVPGVVLVTFKDGTTYREAKDYLKSLGYEIEGRNSYWTASNFKPVDSTVLKTVDIFEIKVSEGKENEAIAEVLKSPLVRVAEKNFIITIPDCSKGPC